MDSVKGDLGRQFAGLSWANWAKVAACLSILWTAHQRSGVRLQALIGCAARCGSPKAILLSLRRSCAEEHSGAAADLHFLLGDIESFVNVNAGASAMNVRTWYEILDHALGEA